MKKSAKLVMLAVLTLVLAVPTMAVSQDKTPATKTQADGSKGLRVYWSTHSMLWYAPGPFGVLAKAAGFSDYKEMGHSRIGASRVEQHWKQAPQEKKALEKGDIDVFVMAPIGFPDEGIENFVKLGLEHNPNMRFTAQISWGCYDMDMNLFPGSMQKAGNNVNRNKTPEELQKINADNIKTAQAQADAINKKYGKGRTVLFLVPSAQTNVALRTKVFKKEIGIETQGELFRDAISHPGPAQEALNTYLYFAVIFGKSPVGLPRTSLLTNKYDDKVNLALQELAWETAISYPYSGVKGKSGDKTLVPAQTEKKDTPPADKKDAQPGKKDPQPPQKGGLPGKVFPGGLPKGFPGLPGKGAAAAAPIGNVLSQAALDKLKLTEEQQRQVQELQRVVELSIQGILNEDQRKQLDEMKKQKK
ncbi:MAG TPA: hypothetical protein VE988_24365 [Gemmataceae bacterium]|nr:hypothetical protein [Gemmataceae bacterium]